MANCCPRQPTCAKYFSTAWADMRETIYNPDCAVKKKVLRQRTPCEHFVSGPCSVGMPVPFPLKDDPNLPKLAENLYRQESVSQVLSYLKYYLRLVRLRLEDGGSGRHAREIARVEEGLGFTRSPQRDHDDS
ncbi:MAG: hypothetical protein ABIH38_05385 [Patescibacteria group bacterium]